MSIDSFVYTISSNSIYSKYTLVQWDGDIDDVTGEAISYTSDVPLASAEGDSLMEMQKLREVVENYLLSKKQVILIDHHREKIFSDIQGDLAFSSLVKESDYDFKAIDANRTITRIIEKSFPMPEVNEETYLTGKAKEDSVCTIS